jgi:uncharacterized repeat protein (TIGR03803 family)
MHLLRNRQIRDRRFVFFAVVTLAASQASPVAAQNVCGPFIKFNFTSTDPYPSGLISADSQGNVYGTAGGTIWKYSQTGGFSTLASFSSSTPTKLSGVVRDSAGNLWGTNAWGGVNCGANSNGCGFIYELTSGGALNTVYQFSGTDGATPGPLVFDSQGNLWGLTNLGGTPFNASQSQYGNGTIFKYTPSTGTFTNPLLFPAGGLSVQPSGRVVFDNNGNLYGAAGPGANSDGSLFEFSSGGVLTTLFSFSGSNGSGPNGYLAFDGKSTLYGTTYEGGGGSGGSSFGYGSIFQYSLQSGTLTTLYAFNGTATTGELPTGGPTLDALGNLYGTTSYGGIVNVDDGVAWEYSPSGGLSALVAFNGANGAIPDATLAFDSQGNLWGTTNQGGSIGYGTLYEFTPNTGSGCGPSVSSLTFSPASIPNGGSTTGTITLSGPAPSGGSVVSLSTGYPYVDLPGTVTVPAGSTSATFTATAEAFTNSTETVAITATLATSNAQGTLTVTPGVAVNSISFRPSKVTGGTSTTATVTLASAAPVGGNQVYVQFCANCNPADPNPPVQLPVTVTVPAGQTSLSFSMGTICTTTSQTVQIFAQSGGAQATSNLTVNSSSSCGPVISTLTLNPTTVVGGTSSSGTVTLTAAAPSSGAVITLSSNSNSASVPGSVTVAAGNTTASFTVTTSSVTSTTTATITATVGSSVADVSLTITPLLAVTSVTLNPTSVTGGSSSQGTVTLDGPAPSGGVTVSLSSNFSSASVPASVTVAAGNISASFTVTTTPITGTLTAAITATLGSSVAQAFLTITGGSAVSLSSLTLNPTSVSGRNNSTGTVTLSAAAPSGGATVSLSSNNTSVATVPSSATVSAGQTSASFTVRTQRVQSNTSVLISGTYAGGTQSATLTVTSGGH